MSDRERLRESLTRILDDFQLGPPGPGSAANGAPARRFAPQLTLVLGGAALLAIAVGALVASHPSSRGASSPAPVAASSTPVALAPATELAASPPREDAPPAPSQPGERSPLEPRSSARAAAHLVSDSLAEEVRLLSRAERDLSAGLNEDAVATLGEHEHRFPRGALTEQRLAAQVETLCALRRLPDARAARTRLTRAFPGSPHLSGVRSFCGSELEAVEP